MPDGLSGHLQLDRHGHANQYPLALIAAANHYFINSVFANVPAQKSCSLKRPQVLPTQKIYAFVDESGQETNGALFLGCSYAKQPGKPRHSAASMKSSKPYR
jgi:hypothetical protein